MQDDSPNGVEEDARGGGKDYTTTVLSQSVGRSCDTQAARKAENCFLARAMVQPYAGKKYRDDGPATVFVHPHWRCLTVEASGQLHTDVYEEIVAEKIFPVFAVENAKAPPFSDLCRKVPHSKRQTSLTSSKN